MVDQVTTKEEASSGAHGGYPNEKKTSPGNKVFNKILQTFWNFVGQNFQIFCEWKFFRKHRQQEFPSEICE